MASALAAAGFRETVKLPPHLLAALVPLLVVVLALDVYCLIDVARARSVRNAPKIAWVIIILAVSAPAGALLYLFLGKDRGRSGGVQSLAPPVASPARPPQKLRISVPPPVPLDGINAYVSQVSTIGLIVVVVIAAGAFGFDARQGLATFLRTRVSSVWQLIIPRFTVNAAAAIAAYLLGLLAAWYETNLLIGSLPVAAMLSGMLCAACYLAFAVALSALAASIVKNTLGAVGLTVVVLLALPIAALAHSIQNWLPSALVNAQAGLVNGAHLTHYLPAIGTALVAAALLLIGTAARLRSREV